MDEYLKRKKNNKKRLYSVDGISGFGRSFQRGNVEFRKPDKFKASRGTIDDFKKPEGLNRHFRGNVITSPKPVIKKTFTPPEENKKRFKLPFVGKEKSKKKLTLKERWQALTKKQKIRRIIALIVIAIALVVGFLVIKGYINLHRVLGGDGSAAALDEDVDPSKLRVEGDGRINILMMGRGGEGHDGADLTDTMILVSINPLEKEAGLVSIPRDLWVNVPNQGSMKINQVFYTGKYSVLNKYSNPSGDVKRKADQAGFDLADKTVESVLGVPVHYHVMIDFNGFEKAVNTVGGVDVNAPKAVREQMLIDGKPYFLNVKPGWKYMNGRDALAYSRSRYTSKGGDFDRSERQRILISALKDKVFSLGTFSNPAKMSQLLDNFGSHAQTNFSAQDLNRLYEITKDISNDKVQSIGLVDPPHDYLTTSNINGLSVVVPKAGINNYYDIQYYIRNTLKDSFMKRENAKVMILNGTRIPGLATRKAEELKSYGYYVGKVENAPTRNYDKTVLVNLRGYDKRYTSHYLELRLKTFALGSIPDNKINPEDSDIVIILGADQGATQQ